MNVETSCIGSRSVTLSWSPWQFDVENKFVCSACTFENEKTSLHCQVCGQLRTPDFSDGDVLQYQAKFFRSGKSLEPWKYSNVVTNETCLRLESLEPNTTYEGKLKYRVLTRQAKKKGGGLFHRRAKNSKSEWTTIPSSSFTFSTLTTDHSTRMETIERVQQFLKGIMEPFPEEEAKPDTYVDKATRVGENLLVAAGTVGVGGKWASVARQAYRMHKSGFAAVVFREDIQKMVIALTSYVGQVAKEFHLSSLDISAGSYYLIWETKREKLLQPDMERMEHAAGAPGIIQEVADEKLLDRTLPFLGFCQIAYRPSPASIQWVLHQYPYKEDQYQLIACRSKSEKFRPAFSLMASRKNRTAVLAIRGTKQADDLITDFLCEYEESAFSFHQNEAKTYKVHSGMLRAAKWMLKGGDSSDSGAEEEVVECLQAKPATKKEMKDLDMQPNAGAGLLTALLSLHEAGYKVTICGHSLGAGVGILMALLLIDIHPDICLEVFGFGTPACVDERLAELCKGASHSRTSAIPGVSSRVVMHNLIYRDDIVSRLSLFNARQFANDIKIMKPRWRPLLDQDTGAYKSKAKSLWAPERRANQVADKREVLLDSTSKFMKRLSHARKSLTSPQSSLGDQDEEADEIVAEFGDDSTSPTPIEGERLVIPGLILHIYEWHGTKQISLVDHNFSFFRNIVASESLISDHKLSKIQEQVRNVKAVRALGAKVQPPVWQSIEDHHNQGMYVNCGVCGYFVGWHLTGNSEAVEIRGTHHCYACGCIVCARCSQERATLPHIGIVSPVRVCDTCYCKMNLYA